MRRSLQVMASDPNERLLRDVASALLERDVSPALLRDLAHGTIPPEQLQQLRDDAHGDSAITMAIDAHEPLSERQRERIVERLLQELDTAPPESREQLRLRSVRPRMQPRRGFLIV